jgi:hypothetical protein
VEVLEETSLSERWTLTSADHALITVKSRANRLGFAVLLLFFRERGRFPRSRSEIDRRKVGVVAQQIDVPAPVGDEPNLSGRTAERHRAEIRNLFGYREATVADAEALEDWLGDQVAAVGAAPEHLVARLEARCREIDTGGEFPSAAADPQSGRDRAPRGVLSLASDVPAEFATSVTVGSTPCPGLVLTAARSSEIKKPQAAQRSRTTAPGFCSSQARRV